MFRVLSWWHSSPPVNYGIEKTEITENGFSLEHIKLKLWEFIEIFKCAPWEPYFFFLNILINNYLAQSNLFKMDTKGTKTRIGLKEVDIVRRLVSFSQEDSVIEVPVRRGLSDCTARHVTFNQLLVISLVWDACCGKLKVSASLLYTTLLLLINREDHCLCQKSVVWNLLYVFDILGDIWTRCFHVWSKCLQWYYWWKGKWYLPYLYFLYYFYIEGCLVIMFMIIKKYTIIIICY